MIRGLLGTLTLVFVGLKLAGITEVANWSWWLVFTPSIVALVWTLILIVVFLAAMVWANK